MLAALGCVGLAAAALQLATQRRSDGAAKGVVAASLVSLIVGIFVMPVPFTEYFMMPIPLLAIFEAAVIAEVIGFLGRGRWRPWRKTVLPLVVTLGAAIALACVLLHFRPPVIETSAELVAWIVAGVVILAMCRMRWKYAAMLVLVGMMTLFPLRRFQRLFDLSNEQNWRTIGFVYAHSTPTDTVFDGWKGITAPFRPHAWYWFFLHREIRLMVPPEAWGELLAGLKNGTIRPKLVVMDEDTRELPAEIVRFFEEHYEPGGVGDVWVRKEK